MTCWKDIANLLVWVLWVHLATYTQNDNINSENFQVYLQTENQLYHSNFSGNITKICKLLILGTSDLLKIKTSILIWMPKINFFIHFFLMYYILKNISNNISFQFRLLTENTNHKIFQKIQKILFCGYFKFLNVPVFYHPSKNQRKIMEKNARTFSKNFTTQENIRISRLRKRLRNVCNKENFKPDLSNTLDKSLCTYFCSLCQAF